MKPPGETVYRSGGRSPPDTSDFPNSGSYSAILALTFWFVWGCSSVG